MAVPAVFSIPASPTLVVLAHFPSTGPTSSSTLAFGAVARLTSALPTLASFALPIALPDHGRVVARRGPTAGEILDGGRIGLAHPLLLFS